MNNKLLIDTDAFKVIEENLVLQLLNNEISPENLVIIGIQRRGADLAKRISALLGHKTGKKLLEGEVDINLYRDDWSIRPHGTPAIGKSLIPCDLAGRNVLLVDDVLFTGRTVRSAIEAILDYGRPASIKLLVFIDRGHRELPIFAAYAGKVIDTQKNQHIDVFLKERDGKDMVCISE